MNTETMDRQPSVELLRGATEALAKTLGRFPLPFAAAFVITVLMIFNFLLADFIYETNGSYYYSFGIYYDAFFFTAFLAVFLFLAVKLFSESLKLHWLPAYGLAALLLPLLALRVYTSPDADAVLMFLAPGLVLLTMVAPFLARKTTGEAIWDFNRAAWLSVGIGFAGAIILALGLSVGLYAVATLFPIESSELSHLPYVLAQRAILILSFGLLWPCLTFAGIPSGFAVTAVKIPWGLKTLVGKILVPLIIIFLIILYAYLAKVLFFWELPQGQVATLVSLYATSGVVTYILIYPLRDGEDALIRFYARWFFPALIPLLGLLTVALGRRIIDYGVTEERYAVCVFGLWLALGAITHFIAKRAQLKSLILSLACLLLLASFGPWGAASMSLRSQLSHLEALLAQNGLLEDNKIHPASAMIDWDDNKRIVSILEHLHESRQWQEVRAWLETRGLDFEEEPFPSEVTDSLGLEDAYGDQEHPQFHLYASEPEHLKVDGFQDMISFNLNEPPTVYKVERSEHDYYKLAMDSKKLSLIVSTTDGGRLVFPLRPVIEQHRDGQPPNLIMQEESEELRGKIHIGMLNGTIKNDVPDLNHVSGVLLISQKR